MNAMRRFWAIAMPVLAAVLVAGCGSPTPTIMPTRTPQAPATVPPVVTETVPTATPTPLPPLKNLDLGVPAGDTYNIAGGVVDSERGLLYVVASDGDARDDGGVLTVVDLASGEIKASVPLPLAPQWPLSLALSGDGSRLYVTGGTPDQGEMAVAVATGAGTRPLGEVFGTLSGARVLALDAATGSLYVANQNALRRLDALTLKEQAIASLPGTISPSVLMAVSSQSGRVYLCGSGDNVISVFRASDLAQTATLEPGAQVYGLSADPRGPYAAAMTQAFTRLLPVSRAALILGDRVARQWDAGENFTIGRVNWDEQGRALLLSDGAQDGKQRSRIQVALPATGEIVKTLDLPYANFQYSFLSVYSGALLHLGETLYAISLDTGELGPALPLGINLVQLALDEAAGRLFALDSAGAVHVVEVPAMNRVATWRAAEVARDRPYWGEMSLHGGRLYVADFARDVTVVLDPATGGKIAEIPKAGQVSSDSAGNRLFVTNQGVYIADAATHQIVGSIDATIHDTGTMYSPGALESLYDAGSGLLFVTMTNNGTGSGHRTWLDVYDGKTLTLADSPIKSDQRFVDGVLVDAQAGRVWLASSYPRATLTAWALDGRVLLRSIGAGGSLYLDAARKRLYVRTWGGLVAVDSESGDVVGYRSLNVQYPDLAALDTRTPRFYITSYNSATLLGTDPDATGVSAESPGALPVYLVRQIAAGEGGAMLAVSATNESGYTAVYHREGDGWVRVLGSLPEGGSLRVVAAPGKRDTFFAYPVESYSPLGLYRSTDGGRTWAPSVRGLTDFYVRDLALSPYFGADGTALLLAGETGIFQTTDGGDTWRKISDIVGVRASAAPGPSFVVLAQNPDYTTTFVYLLSGKDGALEKVGELPTMQYFVKAMALSPAFPEDRTALVARESGGGMFLTRDGGRTWTSVGPDIGTYLPRFEFLFAPDYSTSRTVYAMALQTMYGGVEERAMFRSTDGGENWERASNLDPAVVCVAAAPDGNFWAGMTDGRVEPLKLSRMSWQPAPAPMPTPTPLPPPTPAPTPTPMVFLQPPQGLYWPDGIFTQVWKSNESLRQSLGWAADAQAHDTAAAIQAFEGGTMIWRQDVGEVYIVFPPGDWYAITDTWAEGQPDSDPGIVPPEGRLQPVRGFGKVWRNDPWVRERVGWAVEAERGFTAQAQRFEHGWMLRMEGGIYAFVNADIGPAYWQRHEAAQ